MMEDDLDESFYSRGVPLDQGPTLDPGAPQEHNHRITRNIPQYLSVVNNDCNGRVSVRHLYILYTFSLLKVSF